MSDELPYPYENSALHERRERVFLILAGLFLGTLAMLNILGITRFIDLSFTIFGWKVPFVVAVGVLPYPMTFLCTDFISELYGRRRANFVVWIGLLLNLWVIFILWLGSILPGPDMVSGEAVRDAAGRLPVFFEVKKLAFGAVTASMIAYLAAQFCDVYLFHFWKRLTKGKHLWLRNNGSTLVSQIVDTTAVILITHYYAKALPVSPDKPIFEQLLTFIASGYVFKMVAALLDTVPFYVGVHYLSKFLKIDPHREHAL
ncbi:MAG TPA: queuosine precursor transporter [Phycisphaerae bacterium]|nr:queuosine precursor transporter [Phycisphaerae bacterium]HRW55783.1 queuosine precursor transporter [Phycisphaerae bacterium]